MKYDAFISYRHSDLDMYIAKKVHKGLETFKVPRSVQKKSGKKSIKRVFRDQEELPIGSDLGNNISAALMDSEYLLVICSPRTPGSYWVKKEISSFISMHDRKHVLAILVEGEPDQSFPEELLVDENGNAVEPLAADVRGTSKKEINKKMKTELMRLAAPILHCTYDDLRQRHKERKMRKAIVSVALTGFLLSCLGLGFGIYNAKMAQKIQENYIEKQITQSKYLADTSRELLEAGDRRAATLVALSALPSDENDRPYTPEAEYALSEALYAYADTADLDKDRVLTHDLPVISMNYSNDGEYLTTIDKGDCVYLWNSNTGELISKTDTIYDERGYSLDVLYAKSFGDKLAIVTERNLCIYSFDNNLLSFFEITDALSACSAEDSPYIGIVTNDKILVYDIEAEALKVSTSIDSSLGEYSFIKAVRFSPSGQYLACSLYSNDDSLSGKYCILNTETKATDYYSCSGSGISDIYVYDNKDSLVLSYDKDLMFYSSEVPYFFEKNEASGDDICWTYETNYTNEELFMGNLFIKAATFEPTGEFSPEKKHVALCSITKVLFFDYETGEVKATTGLSSPIASMWYSTKGYAILTTRDGIINTIDPSSGFNYTASSLDFDTSVSECMPANGIIAIRNGSDVNVTLISSHESSFLLDTTEYDMHVNEVCESEDGKILSILKQSAVSYEGCFEFINTEDHSILYSESFDTIYSINYYGFIDEKNFIILDSDSSITIIDASSGSVDKYSYPGNASASKMCINNAKDALFFVDFTDIIYFDINNREFKTFETEFEGITYLAADNDFTLYGYDSSIGLFRLNIETGDIDRNFPEEYKASPEALNNLVLAISPDGKYLSLCCMDSMLRILDIEAKETYAQVPFAIRNMCYSEFSENSDKLYIQGDDYHFRVFDLNKKDFSFISQNATNSVIDVIESEGLITVKDVAGLWILTKDSFASKAYIKNGSILTKDNSKIYRCRTNALLVYKFATLEELIEEARKQFPDDSLSEQEKIKYRVE